MTKRPGAERATTYRVAGDRTVWREVDQEGVILDLVTSVYFGLNRAGGFLWPRLLVGTTYDQLVQVLIDSAASPLSWEQADLEISAFLSAVNAENLLITDDFA